ncbi:Uracil-DNA glycosylase [Candidatus Hartigia pinicola]|nr:Uracil-DNA glycosylase [Candidatus Hartigia pinicola]
MFNMLTWCDIIRYEKNKAYFKNLLAYVANERQKGLTIFPSQKDVFNAFYYTELSDVKVVILGQDPYHSLGKAHGLSFSVIPGVRFPPSLTNIYRELKKDIADFKYPEHGCLLSWAYQGVLLLNTVLTVKEGSPNSHANLGWEIFTDTVISVINQYRTGVIFLLWGSSAQKKGRSINTKYHYILKAPHPSPLSAYRGFLGCGHFSKTNNLLQKQKLIPIDWNVMV